MNVRYSVGPETERAGRPREILEFLPTGAVGTIYFGIDAYGTFVDARKATSAKQRFHTRSSRLRSEVARAAELRIVAEDARLAAYECEVEFHALGAAVQRDHFAKRGLER